jgi:hypothetical protein
MTWAAMVALLTLPFVFLFTRSLNLNGGMVWVGPVAGGLVGFLAVLPFSPAISTDSSWEFLAVIAFGPGLATIMGQIGGAWGGSHCYGMRIDRRRSLAMASTPHQVSSEAASRSASSQRTALHFQFSIRQLFWLVFWLSVVLSLIRLAGVSYETALCVLLVWVIYQSATLGAGYKLVRSLGPRWAVRRERRST